MPNVRIRIFRGTNFWDKDLVTTKYVRTDSAKRLTAKRAGQILANTFPRFDELGTRDGLQKSDEGFLAMRSFEPTEKCDYHYILEYAVVSDESD